MAAGLDGPHGLATDATCDVLVSDTDHDRVLTHVFAWRNNERRAALYGRRCRIVAVGAMGTVLVEFDDGERVTTSRRALRRAAQPE